MLLAFQLVFIEAVVEDVVVVTVIIVTNVAVVMIIILIVCAHIALSSIDLLLQAFPESSNFIPKSNLEKHSFDSVLVHSVITVVVVMVAAVVVVVTVVVVCKYCILGQLIISLIISKKTQIKILSHS
jgi:hypothetical protein